MAYIYRGYLALRLHMKLATTTVRRIQALHPAPYPARLSLKRRPYGSIIFSLSRQPNCAPRVYVDDFKKG
jgi:hypothetical protein